MTSYDAFDSQDSQLIVKSKNKSAIRQTHQTQINSPTQGDINMAEDGRGYLLSRRYIKRASDNPPPALSPATTMFSGGMHRSSVNRM